MKLIRLKTPLMANNKTGIDLSYKWVETIDPDLHIDVNTYTDISIFGEMSGRDFMYVRDRVEAKVSDDGGFALLSDGDKSIVASFNACSKAEALSVISTEDRKFYNKNVRRRLQDARGERVALMQDVIGDMVFDEVWTTNDSNDLLDETKNMFQNFHIGGNPALIVWFQGAEFAAKSYYTDALRDELINIAVNGDI
jgi:hypothetical protein